ncbi:hypothetical protein ACU686_17540 [Yinghuangia aomiensis]
MPSDAGDDRVRVVPVPEQPPVDALLHRVPSERGQQRDHRDRHDAHRRLRREVADPEHQSRVRADHQRGQHDEHDGPVQDHDHVEHAVPQHGDGDADRRAQQPEREQALGELPPGEDERHRPEKHHADAAEGQPMQLRPLHAHGALGAHDHRPGGQQRARKQRRERDDDDDVAQPAGAGDAERIGGFLGDVDRSFVQHRGERRDPGQREDPVRGEPPARARQMPVREQQEQHRHDHEVLREPPCPQPQRGTAAGQRRVRYARGGHAVQRYQQVRAVRRGHHQQPAHRIPRPPPHHERPDHRPCRPQHHVAVRQRHQVDAPPHPRMAQRIHGHRHDRHHREHRRHPHQHPLGNPPDRGPYAADGRIGGEGLDSCLGDYRGGAGEPGGEPGVAGGAACPGGERGCGVGLGGGGRRGRRFPARSRARRRLLAHDGGIVGCSVREWAGHTVMLPQRRGARQTARGNPGDRGRMSLVPGTPCLGQWERHRARRPVRSRQGDASPAVDMCGGETT